ncbi:MAG: dethiobiotin synthase [Nannocystaceae bacterium]
MMRIFVVGTDTDCGKTQVCCALLRAARNAGFRVAPFKPAVSGGSGPQSDHQRLLRASGLPAKHLGLVAPLRYATPIAPGIADNRDAFLSPAQHLSVDTSSVISPLTRARAALARLERHTSPDLVVIEGAGGLHVPMPGGTWLPAWIEEFGARPLVVGRLGLGTINHTLLTIEALRSRGMPPFGFVLSQTQPGEDPSRADNPEVIAAATGLACLGILPHDHPEDGTGPDWFRPELWSRIGLTGNS